MKKSIFFVNSNSTAHFCLSILLYYTVNKKMCIESSDLKGFFRFKTLNLTVKQSSAMKSMEILMANANELPSLPWHLQCSSCFYKDHDGNLLKVIQY